MTTDPHDAIVPARRGWYLHCSECGADIFVSRWKWRAKMFLTIDEKLRRRGAFDSLECNSALSIVWKEPKP